MSHSVRGWKHAEDLIDILKLDTSTAQTLVVFPELLPQVPVLILKSVRVSTRRGFPGDAIGGPAVGLGLATWAAATRGGVASYLADLKGKRLAGA